MGKALVHDLGQSVSFGRLPIEGKVLWPMLLSSTDDQGRGLADPDVIKWKVCPNVQEITTENIPALLSALAEPHGEDHGMIELYTDSRGRTLFQAVHWWEYQQLRWAQPSKYDPPSGWTDRIRFSGRGKITIENWDCPGGFADDVLYRNLTEVHTETSQASVGNLTGGQLNSTQLNSTKEKESAQTRSAAAEPGGNGPTTFKEWQEYIRAAKGKQGGCQAAVHHMIETLYCDLDPPAFSYIAKTARKVGGFGRLADLLWQHSTRPPTGDLLAYIQGVARNDQHQTKGQAGTSPEVQERAQGIATALGRRRRDPTSRATGPPLSVVPSPDGAEDL